MTHKTEKPIFNEGGVTVTDTRVIAGDRMFPVVGITAVRTSAIDPDLKWPSVLLLIGIASAIFAVGWPMIVIALIWIVRKKKTYSAVLTTASGDVDAYYNKDKDHVQRFVNAL